MAAENQDMGSALPAGVTGTVGSLLRESRERRGEDLNLVATALRIRQPYLQAIEDGDFQNLPGSTYAVGFVRGYAEYLGLDSKEIVRRFRQENGELANRAELVFPSAVSEGSIPNGALLLLAVAAAGIAYGAWYWYQSRDASIAEAVPPLPERLAALLHRPVGSGSEVVPVTSPDSAKAGDAGQQASAPGQAAVPQSGSAAQSAANSPHEDVVPPSEEETPPAPTTAAAPPPPVPAAPAAPVAQAAKPPVPAASVSAPPAVGDAAVTGIDGKPADSKAAKTGKEGKADSAAKSVAAATPPVAAVPAPGGGEAKPGEPAAGDAKPAAAAPADAGGAARVTLQASEDCWVEIRDGKGLVVVNRLIHRGETYTVPHRPGLVLTAGNAGALKVLVDGSPVGSLGRVGMVRRDISLDADRLKGGIPPVPQPANPEPAQSDAPADSTAPAGDQPQAAPAERAPTE